MYMAACCNYEIQSCTYAHKHSHMHTNTHKYTHIHTNTYTHKHTHTHKKTHTLTQINTHTNKHTQTQTNAHTGQTCNKFAWNSVSLSSSETRYPTHLHCLKRPQGLSSGKYLDSIRAIFSCVIWTACFMERKTSQNNNDNDVMSSYNVKL